jgi:hypothetical protein
MFADICDAVNISRPANGPNHLVSATNSSFTSVAYDRSSTSSAQHASQEGDKSVSSNLFQKKLFGPPIFRFAGKEFDSQWLYRKGADNQAAQGLRANQIR